MVSITAAVLLLIVAGGALVVNKLLPSLTVDTAGKPESSQAEESVQETGGEAGGSQNRRGTDFTQWNQECPWNLIVVNVDNPVPAGYDVITEKYDGTMEVDSRIMDPLSDMIRAAREDGVSFVDFCPATGPIICSGSFLRMKPPAICRMGIPEPTRNPWRPTRGGSGDQRA